MRVSVQCALVALFGVGRAAAAPSTPAPAPSTAAAEQRVETEPPAASSSSGAGLFEQSQQSSRNSAEAEGPEAASARGFELGMSIRSDLYLGKVVDERRAETKAAYGELALKLRAHREGSGDAYAEARLRYGLQGQDHGLIVDLREAYVNLYAGALDLRLGHQIIVWGRADALNPTNNLTPVDLRVRSPVEDDRRIGNVGARAFLNLSPFRLEGVWMPLYRASELPVVLPASVTLSAPAQFPRPRFENGLFAARVHAELDAFEASVSYLYGHAPLPGLTLSGFTAGVDPPEIRIVRTAYDHHVVGADFSTAVGDLGVRAEAAFRRPLRYQERPYAPRPDLQYILGADRSFGAVSVLVQYGGRVAFDWHREPGPILPLDPSLLVNVTPPLPPLVQESVTASINEELAVRNQILFAQRREVQHFASARVEWLVAHETLSLSALGFFNFSTEEWLLYPKLLYRLTDRLSATLGAEIYAGPNDSLFGSIEQQLSAGYGEVRCAL